MKKKPALQEVIDNISSFSEEQINQLSGSHFPQWVKDELIKMIATQEQTRKRGGKTAEQVAFELAMIMTKSSQVVKNELELSSCKSNI